MSLKVLGITGGAGAGKSTVMDYLQEYYNAYLIECDYVARRLQEPGEVCYRPMLDLFGKHVVNADNTINRKAVAQIVFRDKEMLGKLNGIVHPAVKERVRELIRRHQESTLIVIEAALLLEDHYDELCDEIWYIYADEEVRRERLRRMRGYSDERITDVFRNQRSDENFRSHSTLTIDNSSPDVQVMYDQLDSALAQRGIRKVF